MNLKDLTPEKVASLSHAELVEALEIAEELEARAREKKEHYVPNEGQRPIHESDAQIRIVLSGNGAGKTTCGIHEADWWCRGHNPVKDEYTPVPARVIVVLDHPEKVTDHWEPELKKWFKYDSDQFKKRGKPYTTKVDYGGSEILFMFHEQNPDLFESIEADYIIFDEPPPRKIWIALKRGLRKAGSKPRILFLGTPIKCAWMRIELVEPAQKGEIDNVEVFTFSTDVNSDNLGDDALTLMFLGLSEEEIQIRRHGKFYDLSGLALAHIFNQRTHVIDDHAFEWDESWPVAVAIDPHKAKPHHAVMLGCDPDGYLYVLKELKLSALAKDFALELKQWMHGYRVIDIVVDSMGSEPYTGGEGFESFLQVIRKNGVQARSTTFKDKDDEDFIDRIQTSLAIPLEADNFGQKTPKLRILRSCRGLIGDIENVQWMRNKINDENKPKLDISHKDFLAALKYALATNLTPKKHKARVYRVKQGAPQYGWIRPSFRDRLARYR